MLQLVTCDSPAGKLGVTVCYDLRFPEMYQLLAWHLGAQIMLVPSAFTVATGVHTHAHMHAHTQACAHAYKHTCMRAITYVTPLLCVFSLRFLLQVLFSALSVLALGDFCFVEVPRVMAPLDSVQQALDKPWLKQHERELRPASFHVQTVTHSFTHLLTRHAFSRVRFAQP